MANARLIVSLATVDGCLISRSQAKSVAAKFEGFDEVELDFHGVEQIGQGFADELLRVWPLNHSQTRIVVANANDNVSKMIDHIKSRKDLPQPDNSGNVALDVVKVEPMPDFRLLLDFENGERRIFDISPFLKIEPFLPLEDQSLFEMASVDYGTVVWPGNIDIDPETLHSKSFPSRSEMMVAVKAS